MQDSPLPNLVDLYPEANGTSLFGNEHYPILDLLTIEVSRDEQIQPIANLQTPLRNNTNSRRRKRLTRRFQKRSNLHVSGGCAKSWSYVTFKDLGLEETIIYPTGFDMIICSGHKNDLSDKVGVKLLATN